MKLFAFVRRARRTSSAAMTTEPVPVALEQASAPVSAVEKRRRRLSSGSSSWKPSLVAISEDAAVAAAKADADAGKAKGKAKGKPAAAKAKARSSPRAFQPDYDDFRRFGAPTVLPAFAPTAFLF